MSSIGTLENSNNSSSAGAPGKSIAGRMLAVLGREQIRFEEDSRISLPDLFTSSFEGTKKVWQDKTWSKEFEQDIRLQ